MPDRLAARRLLPRPSQDRGKWGRLRERFEWNIPDAVNIAHLCCDSWAEAEPDRVAVIHLGADGSRSEWSYGDLKRASDRLAGALAAQGLMRGDRVAVLMAQHPAVLVAHVAAMKLGAVSVPLFTLFGEDALRYRLADSGARAVVVEAAALDRLMALKADLPELETIVTTGLAAPPVLAFDDIIATPSPGFAPVATDAEDAALMIYTSGTTGEPKGVLHAHRFLYGHLPCLELSLGWFPEQGDVGWTPADWAWIGGLMDMALPCLFYGVPLVSHRFAKFDPDAALRLMAEEGVTRAFVPPTALRLMRQAAVPKDLRLRAVASGGEALGGDLLDWGRTALGCPINEFYGQTECNLVVASVDRVMDRVPSAMGLPVPGHEVAVLGPGDEPVAAGEVGEVCVRAPDPVMFLEYWGKPEATAKKVRDGWLRTGDLALLSEDGQMAFRSRDDDVITSAGYRIGPVEIEQALTSHPDVLMAAVVGQPDPVRTEIVVAHVVPREGASWDGLPETLRDLVRDKVSAHCVPRRVIRADSLPMTATGKILRRALRDVE